MFTPIGFPGVEPPLAIAGAPLALADFTDEKGWFLSVSALFRSPFAQLNYIVDSNRFNYTPFMLNTIGQVLPNPMVAYNGVYNPASALGPLYSVVYTPGSPQPYERRIQITLELPAGSPVDATTIFSATLLRIKIIDEALFLRSIKKFIAEQMIGSKMDRYP